MVESVTDPLLRTVSFEYDEVGRVLLQTLPDGRQIGFDYDPNGNVTVITPPGRPDHTFNYTPVDLGDQYDPPDVGVVPDDTQYSYNSDRQLTQVLRPDGLTIDFDYNLTTGRLETVTAPHGVTTPTYDPVTGNVTNVVGPGGEALSYVYDGSLLTDVTWSGTVSGTVSREFDNNFRTISRTVNGADQVLFDHDDDGLLTQAGNLIIVRDPVTGFIDTTTLGVVTTDRTNSDFGELESEVSQVGGVDILSRTYGRDDLGRIISITETVGGVTTLSEFEYDLVGRLLQVYEDGSLVREYEYDDNGNRLSVTEAPLSMSASSAVPEPAWRIGGDFGMAIQPADESGSLLSSSSVTAIYDDQDRLLEINGTSYTYTPNGELLTRMVGGVDTTYYDYDVYGNLVTVELPDGTVIDYVIDPSSRRIGRVVDGFLEQGFLYRDGLNPIAELDGTGAVVSRFVYGTRGNVPEYMIRSGNTYRIIADHLGSVRMVVDVSSGVVAQEMDYDEWGNVLVDTNPGFQPFGFAGGIYDPATGLVRFGARDYDPEIGRWTAKDPIGFGGGANFYVYVGNDPNNYYDSSGLYADVFIEDNRIDIVVPIFFGGPAWTQEAQDLAVSAIHKYWTRDIQDSYFDGANSYEVTVTVGVLQEYPSGRVPGEGFNYVAFYNKLRPEDVSSHPGRVTLGRCRGWSDEDDYSSYGSWLTPSSLRNLGDPAGWTYGHEAGHLLGIVGHVESLDPEIMNTPGQIGSFPGPVTLRYVLGL